MTTHQAFLAMLVITLAVLAWAFATKGRRYDRDMHLWVSQNIPPALPDGDGLQSLRRVPELPAREWQCDVACAGRAGRAGRRVVAGRMVADRPMSKGPGR